MAPSLLIERMTSGAAAVFLAAAAVLTGVAIGMSVSGNAQTTKEYELQSKVDYLEAQLAQANYRIKYLESRYGRKHR